MTAIKLLPIASALLAFCILAETIQQLSFKVGSGRAERAASFARGVALEPLIWLGALLWAVESIAWVLVLQKTPLSLAYPMMTATYATVPLASLILLRENMTKRQMLGAALIFGGVILVGIAGA